LSVAKIGAARGAILLGVAVAVLALYICNTREEAQENRYATYDDARESLGHGWLPSMLPRSATEIHEWHNSDTNLCFGSFRFDPNERSTMESTLRSGLRRPIRIDRDPSFASPLPLDPAEDQLVNFGFEFYADRDFAFAINWKSGIGYFWNSSS
jgi:hypothetical protein